MREYFTHKEALAKVGRPIQTLREFANAPPGTTGTVIEADRVSPIHYSLIIHWNLSNEKREQHFEIGGEPVLFVTGGKPLVNWFSRDEYERFLCEL
jgi:hypothetical protein